MRLSASLLLAMILMGSILGWVPASAQTTITLNNGFNDPTGIALDAADDVFVVDRQDAEVKTILAGGGYATIFSLGSGLVSPDSIALDGDGDLFITDASTDPVKEFLAAGGFTTVKTIGSGFGLPAGIAVDGSGNVFLADSSKAEVKEILASGGYSTVKILGSGFSFPTGVALDVGGNVFVADAGDQTVKEILAAGNFNTVLTLFNDADPVSTVSNVPTGITVDADENVFLTDKSGDVEVKEILAAGGYSSFKVLGTGFASPTGVAVDSAGNVFVCDEGKNAVDEILAPATTLTGLKASAIEIAVGEHITFTATILTGSGGTPTGMVTFLDGGTALGTAMVAAGSASFTTTALPAGSQTIRARYDGDGTFTGSLSVPVTVLVTGGSTLSTTSISSSINPSAAGRSVAFTASVSGTGGIPTGSVAFIDGTATIGSGTLANGTATFSTASLSPGSYSISAVYGGDATFSGSTAPPLTQIVDSGSIPSTITLSSSLNPSLAGQSVTFTATLSGTGGIPTGGVTFADGATTIGSGTLTDGTATFSTSTLSPGSHSISATYGGDVSFSGSTAPALTQIIVPGSTPSATAVISSLNPSLVGRSVTFTATVSGPGATPTGTVSFTDGSTTLGTVGLSAGVASFTTAALAIGSHSIGVTYPGDHNFTGSTAALTQIVATGTVSSTTALLSSLNPAVVGQSVTFTATVSGAGGTPTGSVTFTDGTKLLGTAGLAAGAAGFTTASLTAGSHSITAAYSGDATFAASTAAALSELVNPAAPTASALASSLNPSALGQAVTLTATVTSGGGTPSGTIIFLDGPQRLGAAPLTAGVATLTTDQLEVGSHSITADFTGSGGFAPSTSTASTQTVNPAPGPPTLYSYQSTLGVTGPAATDNSHFDVPQVGAVDSVGGHLFVVDTDNQRIQVIDTKTLAVVATLGVPGVSGTDNAHFKLPTSVGFDPATNRLFVADTDNDRIQIFDGTSFGYLTTIGVTGVPGIDNQHFNSPVSARLNPSPHRLYVAESGNQRVQIFDADTLVYIATLGTAGVPGSDNDHFEEPNDAELDPVTDQIMVADAGNARIQLFDAGSLAYVATIGSGAGGSPTDNAHFTLPNTASFDQTTNLVLVADAGTNNRVQVFDAATYEFVATLGTTGSSGPANTQFAGPAGTAVDPVHALLFIGDTLNNRVQAYSIAAQAIFAAVLPGSRSVEAGEPATIFATMVNAGPTALGFCQIALPVTAPSGLTLNYQTTDPVTNALTGTLNLPAVILGGNGMQTFLVSLEGDLPFSVADLALDFDCVQAAPAAIVPGVDTVALTVAGAPVPDIVALSATPTGNGVVDVPTGGAAAFAVASVNAGSAAPITVSADTGGASLPVTLTICQSNPVNGQCLASPAGTVTLNFAAGSTPTFSVFLQTSAPIAFAPATARVFVRFEDASGGLHGSTSVAIESP